MTNPRQVHHLQSHPPTDEEITSWIGFKATDELGSGVGKVEDVYRVDDRLEWLLIRHGRSHHFLAPVASAVGSNGTVFLPYTQEVLESAPEIEPGEEAPEEALAAAAEHYRRQ